MVWHLKSLATAEKDGKLSMFDAIDSSVSKGRGADRTARCYSISGSHSVRSFWLPSQPLPRSFRVPALQDVGFAEVNSARAALPQPLLL